jgi:hypothetical protein
MRTTMGLAKGSSMGLEEPRTSLEMETRTTERSSVGGGGGGHDDEEDEKGGRNLSAEKMSRGEELDGRGPLWGGEDKEGPGTQQGRLCGQRW